MSKACRHHEWTHVSPRHSEQLKNANGRYSAFFGKNGKCVSLQGVLKQATNELGKSIFIVDTFEWQNNNRTEYVYVTNTAKKKDELRSNKHCVLTKKGRTLRLRAFES